MRRRCKLQYNVKSSCAGLSRVSTSLFQAPEGVDCRVTPDQDMADERAPGADAAIATVRDLMLESAAGP